MNRPKSSLRLVGVILLALFALVVFYGTVAYVAWQSGQIDRSRAGQEALNAEIARNIELARSDLQAGNLALAERRIDWLLQQNVDDPTALALQATLQARRFVVTPAPVTTRSTPTPAPTILPPTAAPADPAARLNALRRLVESGRYEDAIVQIPAFQLEYPAFERYLTDQLLFDAYIKAGFQLTNGNQIARGIAYFDQAAQLGPLPEEARSQQYYARVYLNAIVYQGINWNVAIPNLIELCQFAPLYQDSCRLLYEARLQYGDALLAGGDACAAVQQFQSAQQYSLNADVNRRLSAAREQCAAATPTPTADDASADDAPTPVTTP